MEELFPRDACNVHCNSLATNVDRQKHNSSNPRNTSQPCERQPVPSMRHALLSPNLGSVRPGNSECRHYRADLHCRQQRLNLFAINLLRHPFRQIRWIPSSLGRSLSALRRSAQCFRLRIVRCHSSQLGGIDEPLSSRRTGSAVFCTLSAFPAVFAPCLRARWSVNRQIGRDTSPLATVVLRQASARV